MIAIPSPGELGIPNYSSWRPAQIDAGRVILEDVNRVTGISAPTAYGKSSLPVMIWAITGDPVVVLTESKALQSQYIDDFSSVGLADIRGQNAYVCRHERDVQVHDGPCHYGYKCSYLSDGCLYFDAVRRARRSAFRVTNPACWLSHNVYTRDGLGPVKWLFIDEADTALESLSSFLSVEIQRGHLRRLLPGSDLIDSVDSADYSPVISWAQTLLRRVPQGKPLAPGEELTRYERRRIRELDELSRSLDTLTRVDTSWVVYLRESEVERGRVTLHAQPIDPSRYVEKYLYRYRVAAEEGQPPTTAPVPRVVLMSATLPEKAVQQLSPGIPYTYRDYPSTIPVARRRIVHVKTSQMRRGREDIPWWTSQIDQIIRDRQDRKGLLMTTSYARKNQFMTRSDWRDKGVLIAHGPRDVEAAVREYKARRPPVVLVSPSLVRGFNFPDNNCRFVIIGKVPYPPPDPVVEARKQLDPSYPAFLAAQTFMQEAGRAVRHEADWAEIIVVDDDWTWFQRANRDYFTRWFREAIDPVTQRYPPKPPILTPDRRDGVLTRA